MSGGVLTHSVISSLCDIDQTISSELSNYIAYDIRDFLPERRHIIRCDGDSCIPFAIKILDSSDNNTDVFCLEIGGQRILNLPLSILSLTGRKIGTIQTFDLTTFLNEIDLTRLASNDIIIFLKSQRPFGLQIRYTYFNIEQRHSRSLLPTKYPFQQLTSWTWTSDIPKHTVTSTINFKNFSKGYLIEVPDITKLRRFRLQLNGHDRWDFGPDLLATSAHRLSSNYLWIPFNPSLPPSPFNCAATSFIGGLDQSRVDSIKCHLEFTEPLTTIKIHSFELNMFQRTSSNNISLVYAHDYELFTQVISPPIVPTTEPVEPLEMSAVLS